jgi:hypothetical protein
MSGGHPRPHWVPLTGGPPQVRTDSPRSLASGIPDVAFTCPSGTPRRAPKSTARNSKEVERGPFNSAEFEELPRTPRSSGQLSHLAAAAVPGCCE